MGLGDLLSFGSGTLVGFALGLLGGGGSILAVPLLVYVAGVKDAHVAIGTSALAVSINAFANLISHARAGTVKWPCAIMFALAGIAGAALGAMLGRLVDGQHLLFLFGLVMLAVAAAMFRRRAAEGDMLVHINPRIAVRLVGAGLVVGLLSGFFGIGGGFLVVPAIMLGSGMATIHAVGSSLVSVGAFGLTKLWCEVLASNESVWKLHERFGFRQEACFREHVVKHGRPQDVLGLGLLKADWPPYRQAAREQLAAKGYALPD